MVSPMAAASIWFEIWEVVDPGKKINFSKQISEKFRFFSPNFTQISTSPEKFQKNLEFSGNFTKNSIFQAKIGHLQQLLGKLFYFSSKVITFENIYFLYNYDKI